MNVCFWGRQLMFADLQKECLILSASNDLRINTTQLCSEDDILARYKNYDVFFLDVNNNTQRDGLNIAYRLRAANCCAYIILLAEDIFFAVEGYEVNAFRFLTTPVPQNGFADIINAVISDMLGNNNIHNYLQVRVSRSNHLVKIDDIELIESDPNTKMRCIFLTTNKEITVKNGLCDLYRKLPQKIFIYSHQRYIINIMKISEVQSQSVIMNSGKRIPIGRTHKYNLEKALSN